MTSDPYAEFAAPAQDDPYAGIATAADEKSPPPAAAQPMTLTVTNRRGKKVSFTAPVDADDAMIRRLAAEATGEPRYAKAIVQRAQPDAPAEAVTTEPDDDSAMSGFIAGALKPIDKMAEWATSTGVGKAIDDFGVSLGFPSAQEAIDHNEEWRRNNTRTGYQTLGSIATTIPLSRLPGGPLAQGAATGAVLTDSDTLGGTARDAAFGAAGGYLGDKALRGLGAVATGVKDQGARLLNQAGIPLTLGQIGRAANNLPGKVVAGLEERLAALPIIGDVVNVARDRGVRALNTALGNRILQNVGETLPKGTPAGHEMVETVSRKLSDRYAKLVPNLRGTVDMQMATDLTAARDLAKQASRDKQFETVIERVLGNRVQGNRTGGSISGQMLKDAESELTRLYSRYKNAQGDEALYGDAIDMARKALRSMVERNNPQHAAELAALNRSWAQLKDVRNAIRQGSDATKASGIVTPGGALRGTARQGYRDPLLESASGILPNRTPDSGTVGNLATVGLFGGAAYVDPREHPYLAAALAGTAAISTRPGQVTLNKLAFGQRPALVSGAAVPLNKLGRYAPQLVQGAPYAAAQLTASGTE